MNIQHFIKRSGILFLFWMGLTASLHWQELLVGALVSLVTSWASIKLVPGDPDEGISLLGWLKFIPVLLWEIVVANIEVIKLVLSPKIRINPGFVKVPTTLKSPRKRWFLANAITLTPGTVTADIIDEDLLIHWIDRKEGTPQEQGKAIKETFEKVLS